MKSLIVLSFLVLPLSAKAADGAAATPETDTATAGGAKSAKLLAGVSVGALVPFSKLTTNVAATLEAGVLLPWADHGAGFTLGITYNQPTAGGDVTDPRVSGGAYNWHLQQRSLVIAPSFLYRVTSLGSVVPYGAIGPRVSLLEQSGTGTAGSDALGKTTETLTRWGVGGRVGVEFLLGPGGITLEALLDWTSLKSVTAGAGTSRVGVTPQVGYRLTM